MASRVDRGGGCPSLKRGARDEKVTRESGVLIRDEGAGVVGDHFAILLTVQLAAVAHLPEGKIEVLAVGANPVTHSLSQGLLNQSCSRGSLLCLACSKYCFTLDAVGLE